MKEFTRIGLDLAKNYFQVHALAESSGLIERKKTIPDQGPLVFLRASAHPYRYGSLRISSFLGARPQPNGT